MIFSGIKQEFDEEWGSHDKKCDVGKHGKTRTFRNNRSVNEASNDKYDAELDELLEEFKLIIESDEDQMGKLSKIINKLIEKHDKIEPQMEDGTRNTLIGTSVVTMLLLAGLCMYFYFSGTDIKSLLSTDTIKNLFKRKEQKDPCSMSYDELHDHFSDLNNEEIATHLTEALKKGTRGFTNDPGKFDQVHPQSFFNPAMNINIPDGLTDTIQDLANSFRDIYVNASHTHHAPIVNDNLHDAKEAIIGNWPWLMCSLVLLFAIERYMKGTEKRIVQMMTGIIMLLGKPKFDNLDSWFFYGLFQTGPSWSETSDYSSVHMEDLPNGHRMENGNNFDSDIEPQMEGQDMVVNTILTYCYGKICGESISKKDVDHFIKKMAPMPKFKESMVGFIDWILKMVQSFGYYIRDAGDFSFKPEEWHGDFEVNAFFAEVETLLTHFNKGAPIDYENGEKLFLLCQKGRSLLKDSERDKRDQVRSILNTLKPWEQKLQRANIVGNGPRHEPLGIMIGGGTGIGKSTSSHSVLLSIMARVLPEEKLKAFEENHNDFIFNRIPETEFWDAYHGQFACLFDDIGQLKDIAGMQGSPYMEAIRAINANNFNLHMAHLEEKGNSNFHSKLIYATTNHKRFQSESLFSTEAFTRRFRVSLMQTPKDEFCSNPSERDMFKRKLDHSKVTFLGDLDMYLWYEHDFFTGQTSSKCYNFDELVDYCVNCFNHTQFVGSNLLEHHQRVKKRAMEQRRKAEVYMNKVEPQGGWFSNKSEHFPPSEHGVFDPECVSRCSNSELDAMGFEEGRDSSYTGPVYDFDDLTDAAKQRYYALYKNLIINGFNLSSSEWNRFVLRCGITKDLKTLFRKKRVGTHFPLGQLKLPSYLDKDYSFEILNQFEKAGRKLNKWFHPHKKVFAFLGIIGTISAGWFVVRNFLGNDEIVENTGELRKRNTPRQSQHPPRQSIGRLGRGIHTQQGLSKGNTDFMEKVFRKNQYTLFVDESKYGTVTFLKGRIMIMPLHFIDGIDHREEDYEERLRTDVRTKPVKITLVPVVAPESCFNFQFNDLECYGDKSGKEDIVVVSLPDSKIHSHMDITKYFTDRDFKESDVIYGILSVPGNRCCTLMQQRIAYKKGLEYTDYSAAHYFCYHADTKRGDCGSLLYLNDVTVSQPTILGIHVAGKFGIGYGIYLQKSYIDMFMKEVPHPQIYYEMEEGEICDQLNDHSVTTVAIRQPNTPNKSRIIQSCLYGKWGEAECAPARLAPFTNDKGDVVDVRKKARDGYKAPCPMVNDEVLELCTLSFIEEMRSTELATKPWDPKIFDFETAVKGVEGIDHFNGLPRNTSAGYPYVFEVKRGGKKDFFGSEGEYEFSSEMCHQLKRDVDNIISKARLGIRCRSLYIDHMKDERRPLEKVAIGKTRMFCGANLAFTIACRMYLMDAVRWCMSNRILNGLAMGINPFSVDWDHLAKYLQGKGKNTFAGDYSGFDKTTAMVFQYQVLNVIESYYYNSTEEDRLVRKVLFEEITNSVHIAEGRIYEWFGSTPSGTFLTTFVNSCVNCIVMRYAITASVLRSRQIDILEAQYKDFGDFIGHLNSNFRMCAFGDDNIIGVADWLSDIVDHSVVAGELARIGFKYTDEDKSENAYVFKDISQITFLKRTFKYDKDVRRFVAPLDLSVILEAPYWTKNNRAQDEVFDTLFTSAKELSLHDSDTFSKYINQFITAAREHFGKEIFPHKQRHLKDKVLSEEFYYF